MADQMRLRDFLGIQEIEHGAGHRADICPA
jgi:hypothetical protein